MDSEKALSAYSRGGGCGIDPKIYRIPSSLPIARQDQALPSKPDWHVSAMAKHDTRPTRRDIISCCLLIFSMKEIGNVETEGISQKFRAKVALEALIGEGHVWMPPALDGILAVKLSARGYRGAIFASITVSSLEAKKGLTTAYIQIFPSVTTGTLRRMLSA